MSSVLLLCPALIAQDGVLRLDINNALPPKSEITCTVQEEPGLSQSLICKTTLHGSMRLTLLDENGQTRELDAARWTADMGVLMEPTNAIVIVEFIDIYGRITFKIYQVINVIGNRA